MMSLHVEAETLAGLRDLMEGEFATLIHAYLTDSTGRLDEMSRALADSDSDGLRRAAHSLKGSSSNLGALTLSALCLALEQQTRQGELFGAKEQVEGIRIEFEAVAAALRDELSVHTSE